MSYYNFDEIVDRQGTYSSKYDECWDWNPYLPKEDYIPMWIADMDFACPQPMLDAMKQRIDRRILGYACLSKADDYYAAVLGWIKRRHGINAAREDILFSSGVVPSARQVIETLSKAGEGVMIHTPNYDSLYGPIMELGRKPVFLPLDNHDGYYTINFEQFEEEAAKPENTLLLFCSPNNPTGRVWTEEELRRTAEICFKHNVSIFVDEIHNDIVRKGVNMISLTALYPGDRRIVTAMSTSKCFSAAGNNHSYVISYDPDIKAAFGHSKYCGAPNPVSIAGIVAAYNECEGWLEAMLEYLDGNFEYLDNFIKNNLPKVKFRISESTFLAWLDLSAYGKTEEEMYREVASTGLYLEYAEDFVGNGEGHARMNLAFPRSVIEKSCNLLKVILDRWDSET